MTPLHKVADATRRVASAYLARDQAIRSAHADGATMRELARATGLSSARIHQIVHGR